MIHVSFLGLKCRMRNIKALGYVKANLIFPRCTPFSLKRLWKISHDNWCGGNATKNAN
jgi:hypothetical protein